MSIHALYQRISCFNVDDAAVFALAFALYGDAHVPTQQLCIMRVRQRNLIGGHDHAVVLAEHLFSIIIIDRTVGVIHDPVMA